MEGLFHFVYCVVSEVCYGGHEYSVGVAYLYGVVEVVDVSCSAGRYDGLLTTPVTAGFELLKKQIHFEKCDNSFNAKGLQQKWPFPPENKPNFRRDYYLPSAETRKNLLIKVTNQPINFQVMVKSEEGAILLIKSIKNKRSNLRRF